jgi:SAM-dependent methyltransferase
VIANRLRGMMPRAVARELMDDPVADAGELERNFVDIERANRWFGAVRSFAAFVRSTGATSVLDVGCGSADIPLALARDAQARGATLHVTCLDHNPQMLDVARRRTHAHPSLAFVEGRGEALPFPDGAFDVVTCNLTLHHCEPGPAATLLRELRRVARLAPCVGDLRRSPLAYVGALAFAYATSTNRLTRHDAPLSVRRSYTPREALALAREAGWRAPVVLVEPFFRLRLSDA